MNRVTAILGRLTGVSALSEKVSQQEQVLAGMRRIDLYQAGVSATELELLDLATRRAKDDLDAINATFDHGQRRAELFFAQIESIKAGSPQ
jgi:hypothetical protein